MKHPTILASVIALVMSGTVGAQLATLPEIMQVTSVNNNGVVAIQLASGANASLWGPGPIAIEHIGGSPHGRVRFSADGQQLSGSTPGANGTEMASYDRITGQWTTHGGLGHVDFGFTSLGWNISGDGSTVVGDALSGGTTPWTGYPTMHAVAWNDDEGLLDLGTMFDSASTQAIAVSADGGIVVGLQQKNEPGGWEKSAVWRKNPNGAYYPNHYILIDPGGDPADGLNQAGPCTAISADGGVIGGHGDVANGGQPWIWSEAGGFVNLGLSTGWPYGSVEAMSADGSVVVGHFDAGQKAFIWTAANGMQELSVFASTYLGVDLGNDQLKSALDISPNGRYICGRGVSQATPQWFGYRLDLGLSTGVPSVPLAPPLHAWPNPVTDVLHLRGPGPGELRILGVDGTEVARMRVAAEATVDLAHLAAGVYTMVLNNGTAVHTQLIVKQ